MQKIYKEAQDIISQYDQGYVTLHDGLMYSQPAIFRMVDFYSNSRYLGGNKDELGRDKPFYNIVNFRVTLAKVATDLDIKDVNISADSPKQWIKAMLLQKEAYEWMKATNFAYFLNKAGYIRPKYGGVLVKKTNQNGELVMEVCDWRNVVTDQVDILGGSILERHYLTAVQLAEKMGSWDAEKVKETLKTFEKVASKYNNSSSDKEESNVSRIEVWEIHGQFPKCVLNDAKGQEDKEGDEYTYSQQKYFILAGDKNTIFYAENEAESPYDFLPWEEVDGRGIGRGVVEESEEAQVWTNDAVINEKNAMDLAGKVVIKTNSQRVGNNILEVDNGRVFTLEDDKDMSAVNLAPTALGEFENQIKKWEMQADRATSTFDANTGEQPPSGTPYSQTALLNQVAARPFDYRREEMGIFLTRIFEKWIIPHLVKKLYNKHVLVSDFSQDELDIIDEGFANYEARKETKKMLLAGIAPTQQDYDALKEGRIDAYRRTGGKRYIKIPEGYFDDVNAKVTVQVTGEQRNKAVVLQSLATILQTVMASYNPNTGKFGVLEDPTLSRIFGTIVEAAGAGLSPIALGIGRTAGVDSSAIPTATAPAAVPSVPTAPVAPAMDMAVS